MAKFQVYLSFPEKVKYGVHTLSLDSGSFEAEASSYPEAFLKATTKAVNSCLYNTEILSSSLHFQLCGEIYKRLFNDDYMRRNSMVWHSRRWVNVADLPPGGIYEMQEARTEGTRKALYRRNKERKKPKSEQLRFNL